MSSIGMKVSKPGVDVKDADDKDLVWSSDFKTFKIYKIVKFTSSGDEKHGLDYAPAFVYMEDYTSTLETGWHRNPHATRVSVDGEKVYYNGSGTVYITLFIDPLDE